MGMFDEINYPPQPCFNCGTEIKIWQSKDGPCELEKLEPSEVESFYGACDSCHAWNEYKVIPPVEMKVELDLDASHTFSYMGQEHITARERATMPCQPPPPVPPVPRRRTRINRL